MRIDLLKSYNQPTPRYTSYPPAPHWQSAEEKLLTSALQQSTAPLSIYVHIPFCERLCLYCGCNVVIRKDHSVAKPYLDQLIAEMDLLNVAHGRFVTQVHLGGGTPTYLNPSQLEQLCHSMRQRFRITANAEMSVEIDPRVTTMDHLRTLRSLGFNRLSMGIQDFDSDVQRTIRRIQTFEETRELFHEARRLGFDSINADLIYGLPLQTRSSFQRTVDLVLELAPSRVSVFSYAHVPAMKRQQRSFEKHLPGEALKLELFLDALHAFTSAEYEHIGIDHFARSDDPLIAARNSGTLHRNFQGYTTHAETDLIGLGVSAISHVGKTFTQNQREWSSYGTALEHGQLPVFRGYVLSADDAIRGAVIEALLCNGRIDKDEIANRFSIDFDSYFMREHAELENIERDGLIHGRESRAIELTAMGRLLTRAVARVFDRFQPAAVASRAV